MLHNMEQRFYITFQWCCYKEEDRKANKYMFNTMSIYKRTKDISVCFTDFPKLSNLCENLNFSVKHTIVTFSPMLVLHILCCNNSLGKKSFFYHNFKVFYNLA